MKTKVKYLFSIALAAMTAASCTDTWDEHYGAGNSTASGESIWDLIKEDSRLSNFTELAENAVYFRDETNPQEKYTFKDLLNGDQIITAFIPTNDALTQEQWDEWKEVQKTQPFTLYQQLMANSITLWRQTTLNGNDADSLTMLNGKKLLFNRAEKTIGGVALDAESFNVPAKNGTLHVVSSTVPFTYNMYEYLKDNVNARRNNMTIFHDFLVENDTIFFDEYNSIEGNPDENGNPTYVDSVRYLTNYLLTRRKHYPGEINTEQYLTWDEGFCAPVDAEDSTYIMIMPTDIAYQNAVEKLKKYYQYANAYTDSEKGNLNSTGVPPRVINNTDSLMNKSMRMDIFTPIVYNVNLQPNAYGRLGRWTKDTFLQDCAQATYFINTYGDTLRSDDTWQKETLFQGTPINMSNGYGILTDTWNLPAKLYKPDININVNSGALYNEKNFTDAGNSYDAKGFSNLIASEWIDSTGRVSKNDYMYFAPNTITSGMDVTFKLIGNDQELSETEVMSGKYDIYVVCVPHYYTTSTDSIEKPTSDYYPKTKLKGTVNYNDGNVATPNKDAQFSNDDYLEYEGEKVDTILLFENFEFPCSYKNMVHCYPTLTISTKGANPLDQRRGFSPRINIDRIILKSKD